ncbi:TfoX/Sxy family protein [Paludicola sp. MB14-C6]|uniref:TfoX/Sxy family protein n=1 Tax=Paludihabitans sp. MB14-C6 TaxID=3070656 RepID=UPI0027DD4EFC|nr:TfoX/Sxy family protein [Paludicola sp. MB14-C6]WMJ24135.1 TfoX/Sxy family protein [Paludicola sp. MB14-C6]
MGELSKLPNIGSVLEQKLNDASIYTIEDLQSIGSKESFFRIRLNDSTACFNVLCALEGAIQDIRWHYLSEETKQNLKAYYKTL